MALEPNISGGQVRRSYLMPTTPGYNTASIEMQVQPSPAFSTVPLCYREDGRTSTTPTRESFQKNDSLERKHPRIVRWSRIGLCVSRITVSILLVAAGAAIVGCEGHALQNFNVTNLGAQFFLPLWPQDLDLAPTITILAVGGVILTFNLIYLISSAIPYCYHHYLLHNALYLTLTFLTLVASSFAIGYSSHIYSTTGAGDNSDSRDTIESWTCRWSNIPSTESTQAAAGITPPAGFARLCWESQAAFDLTIVTVLFEVAALVFGGLGLWLEKKI